MNKEEILKEFIKQIRNDLKLANEAVSMAYESATDSENIAECKYDTKGLEASYLVQGQARRSQELEEALGAFLNLKVKPTQKVLLCSLVILNNDQNKQEIIFIGPASGGLKITYANQEITIVTPVSPLGKALLGQVSGTAIEVTIGKKQRNYQIESIY